MSKGSSKTPRKGGKSAMRSNIASAQLSTHRYDRLVRRINGLTDRVKYLEGIILPPGKRDRKPIPSTTVNSVQKLLEEYFGSD